MTYVVEVTREGRWWMVSVPSIDALTQARHVAEIPLMARELIAVSEGRKVDDVEVDVRYGDINGVAGDQVAKLEKRRRFAELLTTFAAVQTTTLARELVDAKVPLREVAQLLGISHQRVHQLVNGDVVEAPIVEVEAEHEAEVIDLVAALRQSIEAGRARSTSAGRSA